MLGRNIFMKLVSKIRCELKLQLQLQLQLQFNHNARHLQALKVKALHRLSSIQS